MILILRGHVRNSFNDDNLYNLINKIYQTNNDLCIYISTFNIIQNNISWRKIDIINNVVTDEFIKTYFKNLSHLIKYILIINDTQIKLIGNLIGNINNGPAPIIGWKNYWYCKYQIINYINNLFENKQKFIVNLRFDIFSNSNNSSENEIINLIEKYKNKPLTQNIFAKNYKCYGIDNVYIGNLKTQYSLIFNFHHNLDQILKINEKTINQEFLVFVENTNMFCKNILEDFDWQIYINNYTDLQKAGINNEELAIKHWQQYGINEGRICNKIL